MTITEKQIEAAAKAMFCQHYARELWENADCRDKFLADARAALSAAEQAREPSEIDDIIGNAIDHCGYFMEGPINQKVMLAARRVRVDLSNAGLLASSPVPPTAPELPLPTQDVYYPEVAGVVTEYARAIDAKAPDAAQEGWQPIESAPSAKAVLIAYKNRSDKWRIIKAVRYEQFQSAQYFDSYDTAEYCEAKDAYFTPAGWYELIDNWDGFSSVSVNEGKPLFWCDIPTFPLLPPPTTEWRPLPAPPRAEGETK